MYENLALSENGFLFDTRTGFTYSLNRTATFLLREMMDGTSTEELPEKLTQMFEVNSKTASRDVEQFIFRLKDLGVTRPEENGY